jgi:hypothetical protein
VIHVVVADLMFPLAGWNWHLDGQVAGRSSGQIPRASQHDMYAMIKTREGNCQAAIIGAGR